MTCNVMSLNKLQLDPKECRLSKLLIKGIVGTKCLLLPGVLCGQLVFYHSATAATRIGFVMKCSISVIRLPFSRSIKPHTFIALLCIMCCWLLLSCSIVQLWKKGCCCWRFIRKSYHDFPLYGFFFQGFKITSCVIFHLVWWPSLCTNWPVVGVLMSIAYSFLWC